MTLIRRIYQAAIAAVSPRHIIESNFSVSDNNLLIRDGQTTKLVPISPSGLRVAAFGKAVVGMVASIQDIISDKVLSDGVAIIPSGIRQDLTLHHRHDLIPNRNTSSIRIYEGAALNMPDQECVTASAEIFKLASSLGPGDTLLTLVSGGGSALLTLPVPPVTLTDLILVTKSLARAGADINELNTVRKHVEVLKGGGLAVLAYPAKVVSLILSDIVGDPLDCIASGPTVPDTSNCRDALAIIHKYLKKSQIPSTILQCLEHDLKSHYLQQFTKTVQCTSDMADNIIVGSNSLALNAAAEECRASGVIPLVLTQQLTGEASEVGFRLAELAAKILQKNVTSKDWHHISSGIDVNAASQTLADAGGTSQAVCLLLGGETTVTVRGSGKGGRNMELCLAASIRLHDLGVSTDSVIISSIGTDGQDGPTDAAGAVVTSLSAAVDDGSDLKPQQHLINNDSYSYFTKHQLGQCLVKTGLTGTNVMDVVMVYISLNA